MLYVIMYFFFTLLFLYIYLMLIFSHFTFDNDGIKSAKRQVTFILLIFLLLTIIVYDKKLLKFTPKISPLIFKYHVSNYSQHFMPLQIKVKHAVLHQNDDSQVT